MHRFLLVVLVLGMPAVASAVNMKDTVIWTYSDFRNDYANSLLPEIGSSFTARRI